MNRFVGVLLVVLSLTCAGRIAKAGCFPSGGQAIVLNQHHGPALAVPAGCFSAGVHGPAVSLGAPVYAAPFTHAVNLSTLRALRRQHELERLVRLRPAVVVRPRLVNGRRILPLNASPFDRRPFFTFGIGF